MKWYYLGLISIVMMGFACGTKPPTTAMSQDTPLLVIGFRSDNSWPKDGLSEALQTRIIETLTERKWQPRWLDYEVYKGVFKDKRSLDDRLALAQKFKGNDEGYLLFIESLISEVQRSPDDSVSVQTKTRLLFRRSEPPKDFTRVISQRYYVNFHENAEIEVQRQMGTKIAQQLAILTHEIVQDSKPVSTPQP